MIPEEQARERITGMIEVAGWAYREEVLAGRRSGRGSLTTCFMTAVDWL